MGRVLLKVHAIALATGKNTSILDQIDVRLETYLWWPIIRERATTSSRDWLCAEEGDYSQLHLYRGLGKWHER